MIKKLLSVELHRFLIVGVLGFLINAAMLYLTHGVAGWPLALAQIVSAEAAITTSFLVHNAWTYKGAGNQPVYKRYLLFNASAWTGSLINTVVLLTVAYYGHVNYLIALIVGSIAAMSWNYLMNKRVIWQSKLTPHTSH